MNDNLRILNLIADYAGDLDRLHAHFDYDDGLQVRDLVTREVLFQGESPDAAYLLAERYPSVDGDDGLAQALRTLGVEVVEEGEPCAPVQGLSPSQRALRGMR